MGIAKTSVLESTQVSKPQAVSEPKPLVGDAPIHSEMYRYFNLDSTSSPELKVVSDWAMGNSSGVGEALNKLRKLETKLGAPALGETRITKLSNWIRMDNNMRSVRDSYDKEMSVIKSRHAKEIETINNGHGERLEKLKAEVKRIESEQRQANMKYRNRTKTEMDRIKSEYKRQLEELRAMQKAYERGGK